ncbi:uncharacterized protein si:dkey-87o1.2 [Neoarius graeffei]|uniref:uncharacterized protein si:dkey-87o1.2 n=1 Tax=Neoarius graeffei TaxID=443677 RepID=UPI00298CDCD5|nr:uncharacterized protein si:dkey-87o1.2 [Neoarius graeffei]
MKAVWTLGFLAVCIVLVMAFHTIKQEMTIRKTRKQIIFNKEEVKTKEDDILKCKTTLQKLSDEQVSLDKVKYKLTKDIEELGRQTGNTEQNLNTCQTKKTGVQNQKTERASAIDALKTNQNAEILKVQEEIQSLQKQILDRDTKICQYVDKEKDGGRTLCLDKMGASNV